MKRYDSSAPSWPTLSPVEDPIADAIHRIRRVLQLGASELRAHREEIEREIDARVRAKTIPLREMPTSTRTEPSGKTREVVAIGVQPATTGLAGKEHNSVQDCTPCRYRPVTGTQATALKLLRSVPEPMSAKRVARALQWPEHRAVKWLRFFAGKGLLVARRGPDGGHFWAEGAEK